MADFNIRSNVNDLVSSFGSFASQLGGPVVAAIGSVQTAFLTLAANPIGAVLTVLGLAIAAITVGLSKLQPVVDEINVAIAQLSAAWSFLIDTVGSYLGIADAPALSFRDTVAAAGELERATIAVADANNVLIVRSAELRAEQRALALQAADTLQSNEDRIDALNRAEVATRELFDIQREQLDEEIRILAAQQALGSNTREDNEELARLQASRIDLNAMESAQLMAFVAQRSGLIKAEQALEDMRVATAQAEVERMRELRQEREIDLLIAGGATEEEVFEARILRAETIEEQAEIEHERTISRIVEQRDAQAEADEAEMQAIQDKMDAEDEAAQMQMDLDEIAGEAARAQDAETFNNLIAILGEGSAVGKAVALTQATIKGIEGVQNAFTTAQSSPITAIPIIGPAYPFLQAGIAGAFAAQQIRSIIDTPNPPGVVRGAGASVGPAFGPTLTAPQMGQAAQAPTLDSRQISNSRDQALPVFILEGEQEQASSRAQKRARKMRLNRKG